MSKALQRELRELLDRAPSTASFLQDVIATIEQLYAESGDECPEGFGALDQAVEAFDDCEES
jgi:hypothetical protein